MLTTLEKLNDYVHIYKKSFLTQAQQNLHLSANNNTDNNTLVYNELMRLAENDLRNKGFCYTEIKEILHHCMTPITADKFAIRINL